MSISARSATQGRALSDDAVFAANVFQYALPPLPMGGDVSQSDVSSSSGPTVFERDLEGALYHVGDTVSVPAGTVVGPGDSSEAVFPRGLRDNPYQLRVTPHQASDFPH